MGASSVLFCFALVWILPMIGCLSFGLPLRSNIRSQYCADFIFERNVRSRPPTWSPIYPSKTKMRLDMLGLDKAAMGDIKASGDVSVHEVKNPTDNSVGLYIHIPYCRQRCRYCDFAIVPIGDHGNAGSSSQHNAVTDDDSKKNDKEPPDVDEDKLGRREQGFLRMNNRYVSAVVAELKQIAAEHQNKNKDQKIPLRSVYFGGGTPSLAPIESIRAILYHACGSDNPDAPFRLLQGEDKGATWMLPAHATTEITMEMDPGTFDRDHLSSLRELGINRISLGVQSFDDDLLCAMGRTHRRVDILRAIRDIASVFGEKQTENNKESIINYDKVNYSIDLISGCPGLTLAKWVETLHEATAGVQMKTSCGTSDVETKIQKKGPPLLLSSLPPPKHISVYDMQIEEGTVFGKWAEKARADAASKRTQGDQTTTQFIEDEDDDDEDASRKFTVAVPIDNDQQDAPKQKERLLRVPTAGECAFMYKFAAGYLRAKNFEHYEVSSYAAFEQLKNDDENKTEKRVSTTSKRSRHNTIYWEYDGQWYAVGLGATSFVNKKSVARPREMSDYIEWVAQRVNDIEPVGTNNADEDDNEEGDDDEFLTDILLKRLRTIDGLDLTWVETHYGNAVMKDVIAGAKLGLELELAEMTEDKILRLKDPDGLLYSNFIISSIFAELGYME